MLRSRGKLRLDMTLITDAGAMTAGREAVRFHLKARGGLDGHWLVDVTPARPAREMLAQIGHVPLPPYIERARERQSDSDAAAGAKQQTPRPKQADRAWYQTVYADIAKAGSLAAPTAGLHFTPALLEKVSAMGMRRAQVTLHVGLGTFLPVEAPTLAAHPMHAEEYAGARGNRAGHPRAARRSRPHGRRRHHGHANIGKRSAAQILEAHSPGRSP